MIFKGYKKKVVGAVRVPGDKSISHRAVIFGAIAHGETKIEGFLTGDDCLSTLSCMRQLGAEVERDGETVMVKGSGFNGLKEPENVLDVGNSGTSIRLLMGLLSARPFHSVLVGDASIHRRPMDRIMAPLEKMGGQLFGRANNRLAPVAINGTKLEAVTYNSPIASAQVKSALLLAAIQTEGQTTINEPYLSRDHTERMIRAFGGEIKTSKASCSLNGPQKLTGTTIKVPGDISSAAFFIAAALITPGSELKIESVGVNPTRTGLLDVLKDMGADISVNNPRELNNEPVADLVIRHSQLKSTTVGGEMIPKLIDEIPILALLATQAEGETVIRDAAELKVKETNRIQTVTTQLNKLGADIRETEDGMIITGHPGQPLTGGKVESFGDHRIGMMLAIAGQVAKQGVTLEGSEAISVSFPSFVKLLETVR
ncbi:3-phosphoshikimate 1-carboxyvinyltransferase [Scopulibacillus darangshiensis]|nr:3-phosphoshikimate 1-carboxyvinyltransferase [Scopulibacillus darangshiensis]